MSSLVILAASVFEIAE